MGEQRPFLVNGMIQGLPCDPGLRLTSWIRSQWSGVGSRVTGVVGIDLDPEWPGRQVVLIYVPSLN